MSILIADPIFFPTIRKNSGGKRKLIHISNTTTMELNLKVQTMEKPEWLEFENLYEGVEFSLAPKKKISFVVNVNTNHRHFPKDEFREGQVKISFEDSQFRPLQISIILPEIIDKVEVYREVYALDFGTTNSCFSYKTEPDEQEDVETISSPEMPSLVFFHDIASDVVPKYTIGIEARRDIKEKSSQTFSFFRSIKRIIDSPKKIPVLDPLAGMNLKHYKEYYPYEIAAFIIRGILEKAEQQIGKRLHQVVATYPILFTESKKEALKKSYKMAFDLMGKEFREDSLVMNLDETNGAAFSYIYSTLLDEFRSYDVMDKETYLLSYDFGGGTIDVSLLHVKVQRDQKGCLSITPTVRGITGELYYGGDNVTLELLKLLKKKIVLHVAQLFRQDQDEKARVKTKDDKTESNDPWGKGADEEKEDLWGGPHAVEADDLWGGGGKSEGSEKGEEQVQSCFGYYSEEDVDIENIEDPLRYEQALQKVFEYAEVIRMTLEKRCSLKDGLEEYERDRDLFVNRDQTAMRARQIDQDMEFLFPTKFSLYEDGEPEKYETARKLFYELWNEAESLKIRMATRKDGKSTIGEPLKLLSKYMSIDPMVFHSVEASLDELNAQVEDQISRSIEKAHSLYTQVLEEGSGSSAFSVGFQKDSKILLKVLLYGNASNLPLVKKKMLEIFGLDEKDLVFQREMLKNSVSRGACEEYQLCKAFGKGGLIQYTPYDLVNKLPFTVGLLHRELEMLGFKHGFYPLFERNLEAESEGATKVVTSEDCFLIHQNLVDLSLYADYCDGSKPIYIGRFRLRDVDEAAPEDKGEEEVVKFQFEFLKNRQFKLTNLNLEKQFDFTYGGQKWKESENPFSGVH